MAATLYSRRHVLHRLAATTAVAGGFATRVRAASGPSHDEMIAAAKKESGMVWYDHYDGGAANDLLAEFKRAYPFVNKLDFVDIASAQKTAKIVQESTAGGPTADVLLHGAPVTEVVLSARLPPRERAGPRWSVTPSPVQERRRPIDCR